MSQHQTPDLWPLTPADIEKWRTDQCSVIDWLFIWYLIVDEVDVHDFSSYSDIYVSHADKLKSEKWKVLYSSKKSEFKWTKGARKGFEWETDDDEEDEEDDVLTDDTSWRLRQ